jgi:hypothetical protein
VSVSHAYQKNGIGGPSTRPSRLRPSRIARMISASDHAPMPVATSGVMFELTATPNSSAISNPPARCRPGRLPSGPFGVWQLPQAPSPSTRYRPRSTACRSGDGRASVQP